MHYFHTKLPYQKPMLRQIKWWVQNRPIKKNEVLPVLFCQISFQLRTSYWRVEVVPTIQISIFARTLLDGAFSLWVSIKRVWNLFFAKYQAYFFFIYKKLSLYNVLWFYHGTEIRALWFYQKLQNSLFSEEVTGAVLEKKVFLKI